MKITFPNQEIRKWSQPNLDDLSGNLWATRNIDLRTERGKILPSLIVEAINTDGDDAELLRPSALVRSIAGTDATDQWWALCDTVLFKTTDTDPIGAYTQDAIGSSPTNLDYRYSDMDDWEDDLIVSRSDNLERLSGGTWTNSWWTVTLAQPAFIAGIYHPVKKIFNGTLLIGDDRYVHQIRKDDAGNINVANKRLLLSIRFIIKLI